ncbi:MAG: hypothetical protein R3A44_22345 [Caldilineaceae bacterium]
MSVQALLGAGQVRHHHTGSGAPQALHIRWPHGVPCATNVSKAAATSSSSARRQMEDLADK